jgi:hypothetical protein
MSTLPKHTVIEKYDNKKLHLRGKYMYTSKYINATGCLNTILHIRRGAGKSLAFPICSTTKRIFLDGLKKLEQRSHKCVELRGEYVE